METIKIVNKKFLNELSIIAQENTRKRKNYNFHNHSNDTIQRLLNAIEPDTYVVPHKHENPDKREVFILVVGEMALLIFDDIGNITQSIIIDNSTTFIVEIPPRTWHSLVSLKKGTVYYEIKDGPYDVDNDKKFAVWAPSENSDNAKIVLDSWKEFILNNRDKE